MNFNLQITSLLFIILVLLSVFFILKKGCITIKYSLVWIFSSLVLLLLLLFPNLFNLLTSILGFVIESNMLFADLIDMLLFITLALTIVISGQNDKIKLLIQECRF